MQALAHRCHDASVACRRQQSAIACRPHARGPASWPHHLRLSPGAGPRRAVQARIFDGLKNLFPGSGAKKQPDPEKQSLSEEEEGEEEDEGAEMKRLDAEGGGLAEGQGVFGPLAVLLVGFMAEEVEQFRKFMIDMEADMVKIVPATPAMMGGTLGAALESEFPTYEQPPLGTRRTVFLSGMVGAEIMEVIAAYKDEGMPPTVWAAAVPNNWGRVVRELAEEVHADNAAMRQRAQEAQARKAMEQEQDQ
ncbi:hypothetical protein HYH02_005461 [Chlamydomonas schloesseri]|uniref:Uncharacterized protein n=1 Tax=Chlamydomonas schloesseri TaxID=2026947 RepID=A0A835WKU6_9CHLO|nr:hypothetical protein HYH02_005461 [Chlamydomonas schloesseri]|eukprot:KAG2449305.1 hypothetical protein HYH02_005461 [Chlamydomonas schloesseri]